ncbi:MAG: DUF721 domain-containing protein [Planctomycetes bacterium]|nr:DUF721 domain-containing protein [Planctomycetota bacterium]
MAMTLEERQLDDAIKRRAARRIDKTVRLGGKAEDFVRRVVKPRQARFGKVMELWHEMLPAEMAKHCQIADFQAGVLKVAVDSPSHRHEMQICSHALLEQLQTSCPSAKITKIKFVAK